MDKLEHRILTVDSPEVATLLADSSQWRMLAIFTLSERSLSEAAKLLDLKLPTLSYRVNKWLELGLLVVSREEQRQGRAVKYYRATAERFFIPFALTKSATLEALLLAMVRPSHETAIRETAYVLQSGTDNWGMLIHSSRAREGTNLSVTLVTSGDAEKNLNETMLDASEPALGETFTNLHLDFETAKQLQRDLENIYLTYKTKQTEGQQEYLLRLGITPLRVGTKII